MSDQQGRTIQTVGELKQEINTLPDDTKLSLSSDDSMSGIQFQRQQDRVVLSQGQQGRQSS